MFGPNGHVARPAAGLVVENYTRRQADQNSHTKAVSRVSAVVQFLDPHLPQLKAGYVALNACGTVVPSDTALVRAPSTHVAFVAHYFTKSVDEWRAKVARGRADVATKRDVAEIDRMQMDTVDTTVADHWARAVRSLMAVRGFPVPPEP
jgi:hypothetical protein